MPEQLATRPAPLLPTVADAMKELFPDLDGRSLAVSEADITRENMPTLPLCMVALARNDAVNWNWKSGAAKNELFDDFIVEFWLPPLKYKRADGSESPFWAFYDYEAFRDVVLTWAISFVGPRSQRLEFRNLTVESDQYALVLSFRFRAHFNWCAPEPEAGACEPRIMTTAFFSGVLVPPAGECCEEPCETEKECNPCPSE
jgi:hypothetical protein